MAPPRPSSSSSSTRRRRPSKTLLPTVACLLCLLLSQTKMAEAMQFAALSEPYPTLGGVSAGRVLLQDDMSESAAGLATLKAFQTLASAVQVNDIGTGANLRSLLDAVAQVRQAYDSINNLAGPAARATAAKKIVSMEQLLFKTVSAELGDLALVAGLLALAAFILITVAGGLFAAAGGILIGTTSSALAATLPAVRSTRNASDTPMWYENPQFLDAVNQVDSSTHAVVDWAAASPQAFDTLSLAFGIIDLADVMVSPNVVDARTAAQQAIKDGASSILNASRNLVFGSRG